MTLVLDRAEQSPEDLLPAAGPTARQPRRRYLSEDTPWRARDVARGSALGLVGLLASLVCLQGVANEATLRGEIPWVLGSAASAGLVVLAGVSWLLAGFRELRRGLRELEADEELVLGVPPLVRPVRRTRAPLVRQDRSRTTPTSLVAVTGATRYHRSDCLLVRSKPTLPVAEGDRDPLLPCGVCRP